MFTVKHIAVTGEEGLYETDGTTCATLSNAPTSSSRAVMFTTPKGEIVTIDSGSVYVMNSNGKTVADYQLRDPRVIQTDGSYGVPTPYPRG